MRLAGYGPAARAGPEASPLRLVLAAQIHPVRRLDAARVSAGGQAEHAGRPAADKPRSVASQDLQPARIEPLVAQNRPLDLRAASAVLAEGTVRTHDAVARNQKGNRVV